MSKGGVELLLEVNRAHSEEFLRMKNERRVYRKMYPTELAAIKCMDGRVHVPKMTKIPLGIINPYRNLGGKFDLAWPFFQRDVYGWRKYAMENKRDCVVFVTYHFSKGDKHRGCKGFDYDIDAARRFTSNLKEEFDNDFQRGVFWGDSVFYCIQLGIETDTDTLLWHPSDGGAPVDFSLVKDRTAAVLTRAISEAFPDIAENAPNIISDLLPLVEGNIKHSAEIAAAHRTLKAADHNEWVLAVGRGFDWLHEPNMALIVGPWQEDLSKPISVAASVIQGNLDAGRIPDKKVVLMTSGAYREDGPEPCLAERKSRYLRSRSLEVLKRDFPKLLPHLEVLATTLDLRTRKLNVLKD